MTARCTTCSSPLDMPGRPWTRSRGGDCLACMADAGDPECVAAVEAMRGEWTPIERAIEQAASADGWIGRALFAKRREWGWEYWVGQCDAGDWWLGREGDGTCFETDVPSHFMRLPDDPPDDALPAEKES